MTHLSKERDTIRREMLRIKNKPKIGNSKEENLNKLKTKPALGSTSKIIDDPLITKVKKKILTELIPKSEGLLLRVLVSLLVCLNFLPWDVRRY